MLHIVDNFPLSPSLLEKTHVGDTIIFTENAVLALTLENIKQESFTQKIYDHINLCVRKADLLIRNISMSELLRNVAILDDAQFQNAITEDFVIRSYN